MPLFDVQYHLRSGKEITGSPIKADSVEQAATAAYAALERDYVLSSHSDEQAVVIPKESVEFVTLTRTDIPLPAGATLA